jgi:hypothetical protein
MRYHGADMFRTTNFALLALCAFTLTACSGTPQTMLSPTGAESSGAALNPDGSSLKASAPSNLSPGGGAVLDTIRPTLTFTPASGRHTSASFDHELQIVNANDQVVYSSNSASSPHGVPTDLSYSDNYWWRVRARLGDQFGPWSDYAQFRTPDPPNLPTGGGGGSLPFPVPAECGPFGPDNRFACASAVAALSAEWERCRRGDGVGCHRFTRQVGHALASFDPAWTLILAQPGGHACHCGGCGGSDGRTMFREDTVVYNGNRVFDMITGAGGPNPGLSWSPVPGPRSGDSPVLPPLCQ